MSEKTDKPFDPAEAWRKMLADTEKNFNAMATQAMGSTDFSRIMHQIGGAGLGAKKTLGDMMERYLATMNLPSRAELTNIGERLQNVEARLNDILSLLHRMNTGGPANNLAEEKPRPPRTKRPSAPTGAGV
jgi:hypothetical protein